MPAHNGFTLLETVIAIGIVLFGLVSIIALSTSSVIVSSVTSDEFLATNFAREGIEVARAVRDANWLAYDTDSVTNWDAGLSTHGDYTAVMSLVDGAATGAYFEFDPNAFGDTCLDITGDSYDCTALWYNPTTHQYVQVALPGTNMDAYTPTNFARMVYLQPICRNDADPTDEVVITSGVCAAGYTQAGVAVRSEVRWPGRNATVATYILEEYLYDWKF